MTRAIYAIFGGLALAAGVAALIMPSLILGDDTSPLTAHLVREEAAAFVFIGLMFFWCLNHFEQRRPVHFAFLVFTGLFALIHWGDYMNDQRNLLSPVVNTLPVLILGITAPRDSNR